MSKNKQFVKTPSLLAVDETFNDPRFMKVRIDVFESDVPVRGHDFRFSRKALEKAKDSLANIPVLAHVVTKKDENGNEVLDYGAHDFHVEEDKFKDGQEKLIYDEVPVGVIPESNNLEIWDNDAGHAVLSATAYLYRDYGNYVCSILEKRDGRTDVSAEVDIGEDLTYITDDKINETDYAFLYGVTLLGEDINPAIESAHAEMLSSNDKFLSIMQELKESLDNYTAAVNAAQKLEEGGKGLMNHFEELLQAYGKTAEDITFEHENLSDEELDKAFAEAFPASDNKASLTLSVNNGKETKTLAKNLAEKIQALSNLVNASYGESDDDYYCVDVFEEPNYVLMHGWLSDKHYKQEYESSEGNYTLSGDRVEVFMSFLTKEEQDKLVQDKVDFEAMAKELAEFKAEPEKMEILNNEDYIPIKETKEYEELLSNHLNITKEELSTKLDAILLSQFKKLNKENLAANNSSCKGKFFAKTKEVSTGRYGGMFST